MAPPQTSQYVKSAFDKGKLKIHNLMPSLERTYLAIGTTIGKYRILEEIDRGGMAVVYKVLQLDLDRVVALKVLPANITINSRFVERFLAEAHAVAKLNHPNIVNIHEVAVENNVYYLAMDFIDGVNLYYYLNYQKPKLVDVLEITVRLIDALAYAHKQKIVHRDLKLNNVIMRDSLTPVLIDFGLAKALEGEEGTITKTGEIMGSPAYMAPERLFGQNTDARSDICSVGIMLYEMLTFKNPYLDPRSIHQTTLNVIEANPIPPRKLMMWIPPEIEAITLKAMHKDPTRRYQTMEEFAADIRRYQKGEPVLANPPSLPMRVRHFVKKYRASIAIVALVSLFVAFFFFSMYLQKKKEQPYWQVMYQKHFNGTLLGNEWAQYPGARVDNTNLWTVHNGELFSPSGASFVRLDRPVTRDTRVEFDIRSVDKNFFNIGFFLYGSCPDSGYCFHIYRGTSGECGITFPGSDYLFSESNSVVLPATNRFHVAIERNDNILVFKINDILVARICDYYPPVGRNHQNLGFFVNGAACAIDYISVYRFAVPALSSPTLVADRLVERGDLTSAIEEYKELLIDNSSGATEPDVFLKIADCFIRLGDFGAAKTVLTNSHMKNMSPALLMKSQYLFGIMQSRQGNIPAADSAFVKMSVLAGMNPLFLSALITMVSELRTTLAQDDPAAAESKAVYLSKQYPKYSHLLGSVQQEIMDYYTAHGSLDAAIDVGQSMLALHTADLDIVVTARVALGRLYMAKQKKSAALDMFNWCIAAHTASQAKWQAWMELAAVYFYDGNFPDAYTTYRKVYQDCPKSLITCWLARLKMAEMSSFTSCDDTPAAILSDIIQSQQPFILPRTIAQYYSGQISADDLNTFWNQYFPGDNLYLLLNANKAILDHQKSTAEDYLSALEESVPSPSWLQMQIGVLHSAVRNSKW